jgi:hypothetical protein
MNMLTLAAVEWLASGFYLWTAVAAFIVFLLFASAGESLGGASVIVIAFIAFLELAVGVQVLAWLAAHPWAACISLVVYLPIGVCWSLFRWNWHVGAEIRRIIGERDGWTKLETQRGTIPDDLKERWAQYVDSNAPKASRDKSRICFWIGYWPISIVWFVVSDFLTELVEKIYAYVSSWFDAIAERHKRNAKL